MLKTLMNLPTDGPYFASYLSKKGFKTDTLSYYVKSGWLVRLHRGVYGRPGKNYDILQVIKAAQEQLNAPIYVGGKSALALHGVTYFIMNRPQYQLYHSSKYRVNEYFKSFNNLALIKESLFHNLEDGMTKFKDGLILSSRERSILEMTDRVRDDFAYEEYFNILELLISLRPNLLQSLLEKIDSIQVKRLFLSTAKKMNFKWYKRLDLSRITLGSGPRQIVKNGEFDKEFNIVLPRLNNGLQ